MRRRRSRGPAMVSGRIRFAPSIASIRRNGTPPQWSRCRWVRMIASSELCSMPCCARAISDEVPKSIAKRELGPSTRMHVWKRPPLPKESPEPTKRTVTAIAAPRRCRPRAARALAEPEELLEHLVGVLAERRRRAPVAHRRVRQLQRAADERRLAGRVLHRDLHPPMTNLWIVEDAIDGVHGTAREPGRLEPLHPVLRGVLAREVRDDPDQLGAVLQAERV